MTNLQQLGLDPTWARTGGVLLVAILVVVGGGFVIALLRRNTTRAWLRLDWFLPALTKRRAGGDAPYGPLSSALRRGLPSSLLSNRDTKRRGQLRVALRRLGISWLSSPVRRLCQTACLLLFLILFLYVAWPYSAAPVQDKLMADLVFVNIDQQSGDLQFDSDVELNPQEVPRAGRAFLVFDPTAGHTASPALPVSLVSRQGMRVTLRAEQGLTDQALDTLLTDDPAGWSLHNIDPRAWPAHYAQDLQRKEMVPAELFLAIDPLVSLSTAVASRSWVWSLACAGLILLVCIAVPRGFCGYVCPLGTTIDLFDWSIGKRVTRFRVAGDGWWVHVKYYLLVGTLISAMCGVLVSGFFSAIPVITRAALMIVDPLENGVLRGWHLVPGMNLGHLVSIAMFLAVLGLGFFRPRFWCKYVCPSGAIFSVGNLFRAVDRKVESSCIHCNKCVEICPFDAIKPDFTTRQTDCTLCQTCAGVCPTQAIKFVDRGNRVELKVLNDPPTGETPIGRRGFLSLASGSAAAVLGGVAVARATQATGAGLGTPHSVLPVRPPGSVPENKFLELCIRCGECFKVCPNNVLQVQGFVQGWEGLWTPAVNADWAGCEPSCNACGQVCPTGAIRALPLEEKRVARMGLALVDEQACLPFAGREACDLCVQECNAAGYKAIEYRQVGTQVDSQGQPIEGSGFLAPVVLADRCVGCGLCQTRCYGVNVKQRHVLSTSAIVIEAGEGHEDRISTGSYQALRAAKNHAPKKHDAVSAEDDATSADRSANPQAKDFGDNPFGL